MRTLKVPAFRLRFPLSEVECWADRYEYEDDNPAIRIGQQARERGWYTRDDLRKVAAWKTSRSKPRVALNSEEAVRDATRLALVTTDERLRIGTPTLLQGVLMPTSSVLLHLGHRDPYPILDVRALWSLGVDKPPLYYAFEYWWAYVETCRALTSEANVPMRTLDRALWQYSNEMQSHPGQPDPCAQS